MKANHPLKVIDHSVSQEAFELVYDERLDMLVTKPQPKAEELPKYYESTDYISHTDSSRSIMDRVYQFVKGHNTKRKLKLINRLNLTNKKMLDYGCGTGDFLNAMINKGWQAVGFEPNEGARKKAALKSQVKIYGNSDHDALEKNQFDLITLWHVLEHIPDLQLRLESLRDMLNQNGRLVIAVPNFRSWDAAFYRNYWAGYDVPRHLWHFSRQSIKRLCAEHRMEVESIAPMKFDAYYVSLLSEKYKRGWMNLFTAFFVASRSNMKAARTGEYSSLIYVIKKSE